MIFVAGATGFVGRHLIKALKEKGMKVRCLVRTEAKAELCRAEGFEAVIGSITEKDSFRGCLKDVETVVHLVGIIKEEGSQTFEKVHVEGTGNLIEEAKTAKVGRFFYQSALGASSDSNSLYRRTKAEAEKIVKESGIPYTIFRPSLIVGKGDGFTETLKKIINAGPVVPVPGAGKARFQPIYIGDWIKCFLKIIESPSGLNGVFEFGGPEHLSYEEILRLVMEATGRVKPVVHVPMGIARLGIPFIGGVARLLGMDVPTATPEQLELLETDNICGTDSVESQFGFKPVAFRDALSYFTTRTGQAA
jgi:NADH dehydrogenase